jgi:sigma-E factor negative regulatory protein RseB
MPGSTAMPMLRLTVSAVLAAAATWPLAAEPATTRALSQREPTQEVRAWLVRIHRAANHSNFQGTFIVSGGGVVASARIAHFCDGRNQFERIESLDGPPQQVFRHNDVVHTLWPASKTARVEQRDLLTSFPALLMSGNDRIHDVYELQTQADERIAGREAHVLWVRPRDAHRYGYRLWADKASGLLLRSDVLGDRMEILETAAFSDVAIGIPPRIDSVLQPMRRLEGYRVVRPVLRSTTLDVEGWAMRQLPPGFRQVSSVRRRIDGSAGAEPAAATASTSEIARDALQSIYSDGLTHVSLFIEPYDPLRHTRPLITSLGATQTLMHRQGPWWITLVGDVPATTLHAFANGLERSR